MAHPYAGHKQNAVAHRRANLLTKGDEYARGGRTRKPHVNININHLPRTAEPPPVAGGVATGVPGMIGNAPLPMGAPPAGPMPGGPPPNPIMRKQGGRAGSYKSGISTKENISKWEHKYGDNRARGGYVGGADSGVGRLEKIKKYGLSPKKSK